MQSAESIKPIIESITKGLVKGEMKFSDEDDEIILNPEGLLRLNVSASKSDNVQKISIKISWYIEEEKSGKKKLMNVSSREKEKSK